MTKNATTTTSIGICGCGYVGGAIHTFFLNLQTTAVFVYDKYNKAIGGALKDLVHTDIIFVCLPTPYVANTKNYDMTEISDTIFQLNQLGYRGSIVIKSTVLPNYCWMINTVYPQLAIFNNPEFLSAKTAVQDFADQRNIILGYTKWSAARVAGLCVFFSTTFPLAEITIVRSEEASLVKLACNAFYATKVQFFTELYLCCQKLQINFDDVRNLMVGNGWIHPQHTRVPGPDKQISFGGACLPKDVAAFNGFLERENLMHGVLQSVQTEQALMRPIPTSPRH